MDRSQMDLSQQELRRAAAQKFMESLNQLGSQVNAKAEAVTLDSNPVSDPNITPSGIDAEAIVLEEAAADIEQFMQSQARASAHQSP